MKKVLLVSSSILVIIIGLLGLTGCTKTTNSGETKKEDNVEKIIALSKYDYGDIKSETRTEVEIRDNEICSIIQTTEYETEEMAKEMKDYYDTVVNNDSISEVKLDGNKLIIISDPLKAFSEIKRDENLKAEIIEWYKLMGYTIVE